MTKEQKQSMIDDLSKSLDDNSVIYITDISELDAAATSALRRQCFAKNIKLSVVKNSLLKKAMENVQGKDFKELYDVLPGPTAIMLSEVGNIPAKLIKDFRKKNDKPLLKGAFVEESIYVGDEQLGTLVDIKSKDELIGEIIGLLQSPAKNVISALNSGKSTIAGVVKTLSETIK
ncbi:MAG: 50S ribosomal protein L10 [Crocinitomicaceae bacterium]|nr:50S ribosomal protein L10 [Crocinitomicaceae bacterium]|tara:strand:- start:4298 stop:4822 length:525 start_codon:yes stop_codon:yes gene_type:complete